MSWRQQEKKRRGAVCEPPVDRPPSRLHLLFAAGHFLAVSASSKRARANYRVLNLLKRWAYGALRLELNCLSLLELV
jgi:hypothetical protein